MGTGFEGTFVIPWSQTETDGIPGASPEDMRAGVTWRWTGQAVRVDGPGHIGLLGDAIGVRELHERAARKAQMLTAGAGIRGGRLDVDLPEDQLLDRCFLLTDGQVAYTACWIDTGPGQAGLAAFLGALPPPGRELWIARVVSTPRAEKRSRQPQDRGVICFAAGSQVATPAGPRPVEDLIPGDLVETRDDGPQPVVWRGSHRFSGARLHLEPHLRPVRVAAAALAPGRPNADLLVSPNHRLLITGRMAEQLFAEPEVLVRARDLIEMPGIAVDLTVNRVTYVHLMLERHQILTVNGVESESFHPDEADLTTLSPSDRVTLSGMGPDLEAEPHLYGRAARRRLSPAEAAILASRGLAA